MAFGRPRPVRRNRRGELELNLPEAARQVLGQLCGELRELLGTDDPSLRRLFPTAYLEDPERDAELVALAVDPARAREGHGSRLLAAAADLLREHAFHTAVTWVFTEDTALRSFLEPAGWAVDGARRTLALERPVELVRMHTSLV